MRPVVTGNTAPSCNSFNIGFEKYCIIRNHLELNEISIIDINGIIRLAEHKLKNS